MHYEVAFLGMASYRLYVGSTVYLATLHLTAFFHQYLRGTVPSNTTGICLEYLEFMVISLLLRKPA